jgi:tetratricopeptide (TPR) repeat protein
MKARIITIQIVWTLLGLLLVVDVRGQEAGGGSIKDFKKPSNPPVYGGRVPKGTKATTTKPDAVDPASTNKKADTSRTTAKSRIGGLGAGILDKKSGGGGPVTTTSPSAAPPPKPVATAAVNEDLEDAIAAGNEARTKTPADFDAAEKAYRLAAKIAPTDVRPYEGLGNIFIDQRRYADALAAYEQAVKLGSENPEVFESLGDSYLALGRFSESLEASTRSITLNPKSPGPYYTRAWVNLYLGNGGPAGDNARAMLERWQPSWAGEEPFYTSVVGYFGYRQAGRNEEADKLLSEAGKVCTSVAWVCQPLRYLRGEQTAEEFLARATDDGKMTEAQTYIGVDLALKGRREEALPHLEWVRANGKRDYYEYPLALAWLAAK